MIDVLHISDPGCPWAYSVNPALVALRWRYGAQLNWRHAMIGLAEAGTEYERMGYTPEARAVGNLRFRRRGMPFSTAPVARIPGTWAGCRAVVATRIVDPGRELSVFRVLQRAWFCSDALLDEPDVLARALAGVPGLDVGAVVGAIDDGRAEELFADDRRLARSAAGSPAHGQDKTTTRSGGEVRYTAPTLLFGGGDRALQAGGFQPHAAYDLCVVNLDPTVTRREAPEDVVELLADYPEGLATREVARVLAADNDDPDDDDAEARLLSAVAAGRAWRRDAGNAAVWGAR